MLAALTSLRQKDAPAEAEAAPAAEKGGATLTSHPVASLAPPGADHKGKGAMASGTSEATSPSSSTIGPPSSASTSGEGTDRHLRRMTQDLVDILETMSGGAPPQQQQQLRPPKGLPRRADLAVAERGDSVATMADLEAGRAGEGDGGGEDDAAVVPVLHVRRLTATLVDILRHVSHSPAASQLHHRGNRAEQAGTTEITPQPESAGLLECGSESSFDDKLSLHSAATASSGGAATHALLRAAFVKDEYRGDDVKPFYADQVLVTAASRRAHDLEEAADKAAAAGPDAGETEALPIPHRLQKQRAINWWGLFVLLFFLAAFIFYVWARAAHTLGLGPMLWYGALVLAIEVLGGLAMLPYALCLTVRVTNNSVPPPDDKGLVHTLLAYHLRVVVPCYKEPLEVIEKTVLAALGAPIPTGCSRTVYLLDDGRDIEKKKFIHGLGLAEAVYISGRKRAKGEMNGKSCNINNAVRQIYPEGRAIPLTEVVCVFDADQVPNADFFLKTVPLLDGGQDVGMVLSPQTFYNLNAEGDIFNHANVHFWDYTQPGYDALGLISCTGTNFLLRAKAFQQAGWFPEWTLTEDFALGIELKKLSWQCRYVSEYLAVGEAPEEVRNCFQQRSRWSKGHFQVFFSGHNPIFARGLSPLMRWMYGSVILSYFSAFTSTPLLMLVPMITVWLGAFPIVINQWAAISITIYYAATLLVMYYTRATAHLKSMWFSSVANSILWFAFLKAMYRATLGRWIAGKITFKVTAKGLQRIADLPLRDVWVSACFFIASLVCLIFGLVHFFRGPLDTPLAISLIFMVYNLIPQFLLLQYTVYRKPLVFNAICKLAMLLSTAVLILGVVLVWLLYPRSYNYQQALSQTMFFFDTQREGYLPLSNPVSWRGNAFVADYNTSATLAAATPNASFGDLGFGFGSEFGSDPFGSMQGGGFLGRRLFQADPFAASAGGADPFASAAGSDPFASTAGSGPSAAGSGGGSADPFAAGSSGSGSDPFAAGSTGGGTDPFAAGSAGDPFAPSSGGSGGASDPLAAAAEAALGVAWDLGGGWFSGMSGGNIKATSPIAFTTTLLVWALMSFNTGFGAAGQAAAALDSVRWGSDYLLKVHQAVPGTNDSLLVTRVGDIDTEMLLWYRPEEQALPRPAFAVNTDTGGSDLGGSVAASLAAASIVFRSQNESEYAARLLDKAQEVYAFARSVEGRFSEGDFNLTLLYNTSTFYDDLAWAAGWLYKATKQDSYLSDVYDYYVKYLADESQVAGFKYVYDWDNVFWPMNLLLAQETGRSTFKDQSELFLKNWICAGNVANYTQRGRSYNPWSASLGATANAAAMSLMYADLAEVESASLAREYRCWALSQVRYMLGDAGRSLLVGYGKNPPKRTQDRAAACPDPPEVCNRVTGLLSPDPDTHVLEGALVYGSGKSDAFEDQRGADSNRVGIENNAGLAAALAGVAQLDDGLWEVCLQDYGIFRTSAICGTYLTV